MSENNEFATPFYTREEAKQLIDNYNNFQENVLLNNGEQNKINELLKQGLENSRSAISKQKRLSSFLLGLVLVQLFLIVTLYIYIK